MRDRTEYQVAVKSTWHELWKILQKNAYRERDPVMLVGPFKEGSVIVCAFKQMHTTEEGKRLPNELQKGTLRAIPNKATPNEDSFRIVFRPDDFPDLELFWQTVTGFIATIEQDGLAVETPPELLPYPPNPDVADWNSIFAWYYRWQEATGQRMTVKDLASKLHYNYGHVRQRKMVYDREHGTGKQKE